MPVSDRIREQTPERGPCISGKIQISTLIHAGEAFFKQLVVVRSDACRSGVLPVPAVSPASRYDDPQPVVQEVTLHVPDEVRSDPSSCLRNESVRVISAEEMSLLLCCILAGGRDDPLRAAVRDGIVGLLIFEIFLNEKTAGLHVQIYAVLIKSIFGQDLLKRGPEPLAALKILDLLLSRQALHVNIEPVRDFFCRILVYPVRSLLRQKFKPVFVHAFLKKDPGIRRDRISYSLYP